MVVLNQDKAVYLTGPFTLKSDVLLEINQCDHLTISGVTLRNAPMWT
jgi:hypothetical protein